MFGYLLVLNGSAAGHGWRLLFHLIAEHHLLDMHDGEHELGGTHEPHEAAFSRQALHGGGSDHGFDPMSLHYHAEHHTDDDAEHHAHEVSPSNVPHEHHGRFHTHDGHDTQPDSPVLLTIALDKHCFFSASSLLIPPLVPDAAIVHAKRWPPFIVFPVETPPPRQLS